MNAHKRFKLPMQCSIVHYKFQTGTIHHQLELSSSQYLLQMQIKAQQKTEESKKTLTLSKTNTCMILPIGLPILSNQHEINFNQDHKVISRLVTGLRVK
ncbi:hypothetical protein H5410_005211, partial [Solanum commersonii]